MSDGESKAKDDLGRGRCGQVPAPQRIKSIVVVVPQHLARPKRRVHLVVVMRRRARLLLAADRTQGPKARTKRGRSRGAKKARQVPLTVKLVLPRPNTDGQYFGHAPMSSDPHRGGDAQFIREFKAVIDLK